MKTSETSEIEQMKAALLAVPVKSVTDVATDFNLTLVTFSLRFKRAENISPQKFRKQEFIKTNQSHLLKREKPKSEKILPRMKGIEIEKVNRAKSLLVAFPDMPIDDVAKAVGYANEQTLAVVFSRHRDKSPTARYGQDSPRAYRERKLKEMELSVVSEADLVAA